MLRLTVLTCVSMLMAGCSEMCSNTVVARSLSPDGDHVAVVFQRDCGATTGFSTQISILDAGERLSGGGNTFRADDDHGAAAVGGWGGPLAQSKWLSPHHLLISYAAKSRIFAQEARTAGVTISYRTIGG